MEDSLVKEINEIEASKLSDTELERMVIRKGCSGNSKKTTRNGVRNTTI